jgi:endoglucanase
MNPMTLLLCLLVLIPSLQSMQAQGKTGPQKLYKWGENRIRERPLNSPLSKRLPLITVQGNKFVNDRGDTLVFQGVSVADPDKIAQEGRWSKEVFEKVKELGTTLVRIPVHPAAWRARTPQDYLPLLDQAVEWCTNLDVYVIIDWHSIGNLQMGLFEDPVYYTTKEETYEFWRTIAFHFKGNNTVAFYEIFNEPTLFDGKFGTMSWSEWKRINEDIIKLIRAYDPDRIPLVAGFDWAYDLTPLHYAPIDAERIGYVTHPYPIKRTPPYEPKWEEDFGFAASKYPVIATELGFTLGQQGLKDNGEYGKAIIRFMKKRGISWTAWVFDPDWYPKLIQSWDTYKLTESGEFFEEAMQGRVGQ